MRELEPVHTPGVTTIEQLCEFFNTTADTFAKTLIYEADGKTVVVLVRGDRDVNEVKVANAIGEVIKLT